MQKPEIHRRHAKPDRASQRGVLQPAFPGILPADFPGFRPFFLFFFFILFPVQRFSSMGMDARLLSTNSTSVMERGQS